MSKFIKILAIFTLIVTLGLGSPAANGGMYDSYKQNLLDRNWHLKLNALIDALSASYTATAAQMSALYAYITTWGPVENIPVKIPGTLTYASATQFTVSGDRTGYLPAAATLIVDLGTDGVKFNTVATATYGGGVTTVNLNVSNLTNNLANVMVIAQRNGLYPWGDGRIYSRDYGTPGQAALSAAVTAIGSLPRTLTLYPGAWTMTGFLSIPANITLQFEPGAYLDLAGLKDAAIEDMTLAAACKVTVTGHGLVNGDKVRFYDIRQNYVSGTTHTAEWMGLNNQIYTVTKIDDDNFTIPVNTSAFHAYVPATDPGRACVPVVVKNILASKQKIFNVAAPAHVCFADSYASFISILDPRKQQEVYPEWFGAVGDGVTDDLLALNAARNAMIYYDKMQGLLKLSNWYGVSSTFSLDEIGLTDHGTVHVEGTGRTVSGFVGLAACAGKPVVEVVGTGGVRFKSFGFTGITPAYSPVPDDAPSVALMLGRSQFNPNAGGNRFEDLGFWGFYQYGVIFNFGFATSQWSHCEANVSALTGKVNNNWMFSFFMGAGTDIYGTLSLPSWGAALVPTNATWRSGSNCSADGNTVSDFYMVVNGTKLPGNAGLYLSNTPGVTLERIGLGGLADYYLYALDAVFALRDSGGDGHYGVAGAYVASSTATIRTIRVQNFMPVVDSGIVLQTDGNTALTDSIVDQISQGKIILGRGATNSRFTGLHLLSAFTNAGGYLVNCFISLPISCLVSPDFIDAGSTGNIIQSQMTADSATTITGDLRLGYPGQTTPSKLIVSPYKIAWAGAAPTAGSWCKGDVINNSAKTTGQPRGWDCILNNTFGTLNSGATTGAIASGSPSLVVNSVTGLQEGNWLDIAGITSPLRVLKVASAAVDIQGLSRANPCVVPWTGHGLPDTATVTLSVITQTGWTALNTSHQITYIDANSFSIPVDTSGYAGDYVPAVDLGKITANIVTLSGNASAAVGPTAAVSFHNETTGDAFKAMANVP